MLLLLLLLVLLLLEGVVVVENVAVVRCRERRPIRAGADDDAGLAALGRSGVMVLRDVPGLPKPAAASSTRGALKLRVQASFKVYVIRCILQ